MAAKIWTETENALIVADYFAMLAAEYAQEPYSKAAHNRALAQRIDRNRSAIEFKHQNISAVLKALGEDCIQGYKPAFNYQAALEDAVAGWLARHPDWGARIGTAEGLAERGAIFIEAAPTLSNQPPPDELAQTQTTARKFDIAARDARNRALGQAGEARVLHHEKTSLTEAGRPDLASQVRWVSQEDGDGAGYDIASFTRDGAPRLIEVKTTHGWARTPFHISRNELEVSRGHQRHWCLFRLYHFARAPKAFELRPPLEAHVSLMATQYQAGFS